MGNKFNCIYIDIPWGDGIYGKRSNPNTKFGGGAEHHYPTMSKQEILDFKLEIDKVCDDNAIMIMWATGPSLEFAFEVMKHYGFTYKTFGPIWEKVDKNGEPRILPSYYFGSNIEVTLIGIKGKNNGLFKPSKSLVGQVVRTPLREHSRKPTEVYEKIESAYPNLNKCEFFSRTQREDWTMFGNQVGKFD